MNTSDETRKNIILRIWLFDCFHLVLTFSGCPEKTAFVVK